MKLSKEEARFLSAQMRVEIVKAQGVMDQCRLVLDKLSCDYCGGLDYDGHLCDSVGLEETIQARNEHFKKYANGMACGDQDAFDEHTEYLKMLLANAKRREANEEGTE